MGNTESNVTSGVKKQAGVSTQPLYKLVNLNGGGLLVDMMKRACQNKQYAEIDHAIKTKVEPFLYNKGAGKYIPISKIVLLRNIERPRHKQLPEIRAIENPDEEFDIDQHLPNVKETEYLLNPSAYREVCWDLKKRGAVGESIFHLCLLNATSLHADLAKRLLKFYPKLINDIYMSDEYYGENTLHIAIVNEDPAMVKFLLDAGANVNERCFGAFMSAEDQKPSRTDNQEHEWVDVNTMTNYDGYVYWGEYPLSFAACLGQEECYRLVLARGADPDAQDTNGNTTLHMLVIYEKLDTFDMAYEVGSSLAVRNQLNLTPLTLAAKLGRVEIFFHIMNIEREIYWQLGSITCAAYPLPQIDTIDCETGHISKDSALNLVVFGDKDEHLELLDGILIDLLKTKWNTFVKSRFYRQFYLFTSYFLVSLVSFLLRPGPDLADAEDDDDANGHDNNGNESGGGGGGGGSAGAGGGTGIETKHINDDNNINTVHIANETIQSQHLYYSNRTNVLLANLFNVTDHPQHSINDTQATNLDVNASPFIFMNSAISSAIAMPFIQENESPLWFNTTDASSTDDSIWWSSYPECPLLNMDSNMDKIRFFTELIQLTGAFLYIVAALREMKFLGYHMFIENLMTAPSRVMFLFSCCLMMTIIPLRIFCLTELEDHVCVVIMLTTAPYFLFFCRGFKSVGPFVVMIYRMVMGDLIRFVSIYVVFVMGFAQAYYIIYLSFDNPTTPDGIDDTESNPVPSPMESIVAMFLMSLTNFGDYFGTMERTNHELEGKILFVVFMVIVAVLLVNMLIAMMGNTYQKIAETRNEWQRQWARIVLVVERGVSPVERLKNFNFYSQPMSDGRRALVLRLNMTDSDKEEMKEILEMKRVHERLTKKRNLEREKRERERQKMLEKLLNST